MNWTNKKRRQIHLHRMLFEVRVRNSHTAFDTYTRAKTYLENHLGRPPTPDDFFECFEPITPEQYEEERYHYMLAHDAFGNPKP